MLRIAKYVFYILIAVAIYGVFWFMPKYSYVQKNPGYCANLTKHLYYCGTEADLKSTFETTIENKNLINDIKTNVNSYSTNK